MFAYSVANSHGLGRSTIRYHLEFLSTRFRDGDPQQRGVSWTWCLRLPSHDDPKRAPVPYRVPPHVGAARLTIWRSSNRLPSGSRHMAMRSGTAGSGSRICVTSPPWRSSWIGGRSSTLRYVLSRSTHRSNPVWSQPDSHHRTPSVSPRKANRTWTIPAITGERRFITRTAIRHLRAVSGCAGLRGRARRCRR